MTEALRFQYRITIVIFYNRFGSITSECFDRLKRLSSIHPINIK